MNTATIIFGFLAMPILAAIPFCVFIMYLKHKNKQTGKDVNDMTHMFDNVDRLTPIDMTDYEKWRHWLDEWAVTYVEGHAAGFQSTKRLSIYLENGYYADINFNVQQNDKFEGISLCNMID